RDEAAPRPPRRIPPLLGGLAVIAAGLALMLAAGYATSRWPFAFDRAILVGLRHWHGPAWMPRVAADITALGGGVILTIVVVAVVGLLIVQRLWLTALA
ncbi:hypothetical protein ACTGZS_12530, partial [Streptococcus suis]